MKKRVVFPLFCLIICTLSCKERFDEVISKENIEQVSLKFKSIDGVDTSKIELLENLLYASKGRDAFLKQNVSKHQNDLFDKYLIEEGNISKTTEDLFLFFKSQNVTYEQLFTEFDSVKKIFERNMATLDSIYKKIDSICVSKQKIIDDKEKEKEKIRERLNDMVELTLLSIEETEEDYRDVIRVAIKMVNKTSKRIEAISFDLELTDKLGTKVATLNCRSNTGFTRSNVGNWVYDQWESNEIYKSLKNMNARHLTAKQKIDAINLNGEIISTLHDFEDFTINFEYKSDDKLYGYCPYLDDSDELTLKIKAVNDKTEREIKNRFVYLTRYHEYQSQLFSIK